MTSTSINTTLGTFVAHFSDKGLARLDFPSGSKTRKAKAGSNTPPPTVRPWIEQTTSSLQAVLDGRDPKELPPLDLTGATDFQRKVWKELRRIGRGKTRSYGEIAKAIGNPKASRAVGSACGANPIPVLIPCHRVLAASGKLGGFSGGLDVKVRLLAGEGLEVVKG